MKIIGFDAPHHYTTETIIFNIIDFFFNRSENMNILFPMYFYFFSFLILLFYYNINYNIELTRCHHIQPIDCF